MPIERSIYCWRAVSRAKGDEHETPIIHIHINSDLPEKPSDEDGKIAIREMYAEDGRQIVKALNDALPGGTLNRVLIELLSRRVCDLMVPMYEADAGRARALQLVDIAASCAGDVARAGMYQAAHDKLYDQALCKHGECEATTAGPLVRLVCKKCGFTVQGVDSSKVPAAKSAVDPKKKVFDDRWH